VSAKLGELNERDHTPERYGDIGKCHVMQSEQQSLATFRHRFGAPTPHGTTLEHMPTMKLAIEHGAERGDVAQQLPPVFDRVVGCEQRTGS
jgi:hypothetical protein